MIRWKTAIKIGLLQMELANWEQTRKVDSTVEPGGES